MATKPTAAIARIQAANSDAYDATTNPSGLAQGGHRQNFVPDLQATVDVGQWVEDMAGDIEGLLDGADDSAVAAAASAANAETARAATAALKSDTQALKDAAAGSASAAAGSAAGVNLPAVTIADAGKALLVKSDGSGYTPTLISTPAILPITLTTPAANATGVFAGGTYTFVARAFVGDTTGFYSNYGVAVLNRFVNVYEPGGTVPIYTFTATGGGPTLVASATGTPLVVSHAYQFEFGYTDVQGNVGKSPKVSATTAAAFRPSIGDAFGGGFFQGQITRGGVVYDQISAPASSETTLQYSTDGASPGFSERANGKFITEGSLTAAKYAAARYCDGLTLSGFSDFFLPAEDQLELAYRNSKPSTTANFTSSGANANSVPTGANYTSGNPAQTAVAIFKTGGSQAFAETSYWTTTATDGTSAIAQHFGTGAQIANSLTSSLKVRPWREQVAA